MFEFCCPGGRRAPAHFFTSSTEEKHAFSTGNSSAFPEIGNRAHLNNIAFLVTTIWWKKHLPNPCILGSTSCTCICTQIFRWTWTIMRTHTHYVRPDKFLSKLWTPTHPSTQRQNTWEAICSRFDAIWNVMIRNSVMGSCFVCFGSAVEQIVALSSGLQGWQKLHVETTLYHKFLEKLLRSFQVSRGNHVRNQSF